MLKSKAKQIFLALIIIISLCACATKPKQQIVSSSEFALDTLINISIYDISPKQDPQKILDSSTELIRNFENLLSKTKKNSDVWNVNNAGGNPTKVSNETIEIVKKAIEISQSTDGAFDITIGAVSNLWDFNAQNPEIPDAKLIAQKIKTVDYTKIIINQNTLAIPAETQIDLGGIAKGYIADMLAKHLKQSGVKSAIIDLGGNIIVVGNKGGQPWKVGIQGPFEKRNIPVAVAKVENMSVVTSGIYERYFEKQGTNYHHILNTKTGYPVQNDLASVSVIAKNSMLCDALSTSLFAMGKEKATTYIENFEGVEAVFVTKDQKITKTSGLGKTIPFELIETKN